MIESILAILNVLAGWVDRYLKERRGQKEQKARDDVESDPIQFFDNHFGGVSPNDADKTNETDINQKS